VLIEKYGTIVKTIISMFFLPFFVSALDAVKPKYDFKLTTFLEKPKLLHVMTEEEESVCGLTVVENELFVVRSTPKVYVYDCHIFKLTRELWIPDSPKLTAIVACQHNNCLYLRDSYMKKIIKFDRIIDVVICSWPVMGECCALSITKSYSVLVTLYDCKLVYEYKSDGSLIRMISFPMDNPTHCIQLSNDMFVVVGHLNWKTSQSQVCIIDKDGHILRSHDLDVTELSDHLKMAVDSHGHVIIADYINHTVKLLSPSLTNLGYIHVPGRQLKYPNALHIDELNHRLYIGQFSSECMFILEADVSVSNNIRSVEGINNQQASFLFSFIYLIYITILLFFQSRLKAMAYLILLVYRQ